VASRAAKGVAIDGADFWEYCGFSATRNSKQMPELQSLDRPVLITAWAPSEDFAIFAFIAVDEKTRETGALIEFFYGYPGQNSPPRLVHGSDIMTRFLSDKKQGRPHMSEPKDNPNAGRGDCLAALVVADPLFRCIDRQH
jgi:hypothetical protein